MPSAWFATLQNKFLNTYAQQAATLRLRDGECAMRNKPDSGFCIPHSPSRMGRRFNYFYGYTCLKIAKQLCTMRGPLPRPEGAEQHREVSLILEQGLRVLKA